MSEKKLNRRAFVLTFAMSFLLLMVGMMTFILVTSPKKDTSPSSSKPTGDNVGATDGFYLPTTEERLSILIMGTPKKGESATTFLLVNYCPDKGTIPVMLLPKETYIYSLNGSATTLSGAFDYGGAKYVKQSLEETLQIKIDRYILMDADTYISLSKRIGAVEYEMPYALSYSNGLVNLNLNKGFQLLEGRHIVDLLRYDYGGDLIKRSELTGDIIASSINQNMNLVFSPKVESLFMSMIDQVDTDIGYTDYSSRIESARFLAKLEEHPSYVLPLTGQLNAAGNTFTLTDDCTKVIRSALSFIE